MSTPSLNKLFSGKNGALKYRNDLMKMEQRCQPLDHSDGFLFNCELFLIQTLHLRNVYPRLELTWLEFFCSIRNRLLLHFYPTPFSRSREKHLVGCWSNTFRVQLNQPSRRNLPLLNIAINTVWLRNWLKRCLLYATVKLCFPNIVN